MIMEVDRIKKIPLIGKSLLIKMRTGPIAIVWKR